MNLDTQWISLDMNKQKNIITNLLSLFASSSTLICCALPALFVMFGAGATVVSLTTIFPQLIWLSAHKLKLFIIAGVLLIVSIYFEIKNKDVLCVSKTQTDCTNTRSRSRYILAISLIIYFIGLITTFLLPYLI